MGIKIIDKFILNILNEIMKNQNILYLNMGEMGEVENADINYEKIFDM